MKTVTIPSNSNPWNCVVNGQRYTYPAGTEQSVPDEVADVIEAYNASLPHEAKEEGTPGQVWTKKEKGAGWGDEHKTTMTELAELLNNGAGLAKPLPGQYLQWLSIDLSVPFMWDDGPKPNSEKGGTKGQLWGKTGNNTYGWVDDSGAESEYGHLHLLVNKTVAEFFSDPALKNNMQYRALEELLDDEDELSDAVPIHLDCTDGIINVQTYSADIVSDESHRWLCNVTAPNGEAMLLTIDSVAKTIALSFATPPIIRKLIMKRGDGTSLIPAQSNSWPSVSGGSVPESMTIDAYTHAAVKWSLEVTPGASVSIFYNTRAANIAADEWCMIYNTSGENLFTFTVTKGSESKSYTITLNASIPTA